MRINTFAFSNPSNINRRFKFSKNILFILLGLVTITTIVVIARTNGATKGYSSSSKPQAPVAKAVQLINKEFLFPLKDANGKEISKVKYFLESASLQDDILVKGERARAVQGRTFLILNIKITNGYKQGVQINSKDYIRLIINGNKNELVAADIHNDPVEVQAISTKTTRLGFPIDDSSQTQNNLEIKVGEINGKKESIKINFHK